MIVFFFQAEDGIRDFCLSRGLGDVYKRQSDYKGISPQKDLRPSLVMVVSNKPEAAR